MTDHAGSGTTIPWRDPAGFERVRNRVRDGVELYGIPGGMVPVFFADGKEAADLVEPSAVPTIDARGRTILFLGDLHLFVNGMSLTRSKLRCLKSLLERYKDALVVLCGDIYEMQSTSFRTIRSAIATGLGQRRGTPRLLADVHEQLRAHDVVFLSGNHDPHEWYETDDFVHQIASVFERLVRIKTESGTVLALHGHQVFRDRDQTNFGGIGNVSSSLVKLFFYYEGVGTNLAGNLFLRWMYGHINPHFRQSLPALKSAYSVNTVVFGHSHLAEIDRESGMYVGGLPQHGRITVVKFDESGEADYIEAWYNGLSKALEFTRRKLGLSSPFGDSRSRNP